MPPSGSPQPKWAPLMNQPFPGLRLLPHGGFTLVSTNRMGCRSFGKADAVEPWAHGACTFTKEAGGGCPLVVQGPHGRCMILYHEGQWYMAEMADAPPASPDEPVVAELDAADL